MSILKIDFLHDAVKFELEDNVNNAEFKGVLRSEAFGSFIGNFLLAIC